MKKISLILMAPVLLSGCATSLSTFLERSTRKESIYKDPRNAATGVSGASLSASRRMILAAPKNGTHFVCSEPAPDTAVDQILTTALSGSAKSGRGLDAQLSLADAVALTNLSLATRTELVEIWRTSSYNYCLLLLNGRTTEAREYLAASVIAVGKATNVAMAQAARPAPVVNINSNPPAQTKTQPEGTPPTTPAAPVAPAAAGLGSAKKID